MPIEFGPPFTFSEVTLTASYIRVAESVAVTGVANASMKIYRLTPGRGLLRKVKLRVEVSESSPGRRLLLAINPNEAEATRDFARILRIYLIYARKGGSIRTAF